MLVEQDGTFKAAVEVVIIAAEAGYELLPTGADGQTGIGREQRLAALRFMTSENGIRNLAAALIEAADAAAALENKANGSAI
jgi:hypothetical protein